MKYYFVDLFCGAGGVTTGVHRARFKGKSCAEVIACVNHEPLASAGIIVFAKYDKDSHWIENPWSTRFLIRELLQRAAMAGVGLPRVLKLHHPTGHAYWSAGEYGVQMPNGSFYNKRQHATDIPAYAKDDEKYTSG